MSIKLTRTARILAIASIIALMISFLPLVAMHGSLNPVSAEETAVTAGTQQRRIGSWWWRSSEAKNEAYRDAYLPILKAAGVTEIYLYDYTGFWSTNAASQEKIHVFIQEAMKYGMRTAILMDDPALAKDAKLSLEYVQRLRDAWFKYKETYPDDALYGIHFDCEPGTTTTILQQYCDNLVQNAINELIANNIYVEFDVNPAWSGAIGCKLNGIQGLYNILASTLGNGKGTLSLMSYRTTAEKIVSRANEKKAIDSCIQYNCDFMCGLETDNVEAGVDLHNKTKDYVVGVVNDVFKILDNRNYSVQYGMAIHNVSTFCNLAGDVVPTTTTKAPTTTTLAPTTKKTILRGDANMDETVDMKDVLTLRKYIAGMIQWWDLDTEGGDCNIDTIIDMKDVLLLRRYLANLAELPD